MTFCYMQPNAILMEMVSNTASTPPSSCTTVFLLKLLCHDGTLYLLEIPGSVPCACQALCEPFLLIDFLYWPDSFFRDLLPSGWALQPLGPQAHLFHGIYHYSQEWAIFMLSLL